jgi:RimJ/RimL family protein N-acetyltransferase
MSDYVGLLLMRFPLHKLVAYVPVALTEYVELHTRSGFELEGVLHDHRWIAGGPHDVAVLGLLRAQFSGAG